MVRACPASETVSNATSMVMLIAGLSGPTRSVAVASKVSVSVSAKPRAASSTKSMSSPAPLPVVIVDARFVVSVPAVMSRSVPMASVNVTACASAVDPAVCERTSV